ncbi:MAG: hypothetical protein M3R15_02520 [Acidobacteriota bacterium]|nr:hypothetical protein [Acidobacteriota bacterium]
MMNDERGEMEDAELHFLAVRHAFKCPGRGFAGVHSNTARRSGTPRRFGSDSRRHHGQWLNAEM